MKFEPRFYEVVGSGGNVFAVTVPKIQCPLIAGLLSVFLITQRVVIYARRLSNTLDSAIGQHIWFSLESDASVDFETFPVRGGISFVGLPERQSIPSQGRARKVRVLCAGESSGEDQIYTCFFCFSGEVSYSLNDAFREFFHPEQLEVGIPPGLTV